MRPVAMILLHDININTLIYPPSYSILYPKESENLELYQEINKFWGLKPNPPKTAETGVRVTHATINI